MFQFDQCCWVRNGTDIFTPAQLAAAFPQGRRILLLEGPTLCGKTFLIRAWQGRRVSVDAFSDLIRDSVEDKEGVVRSLQCPLLCLDNADFLQGRAAFQRAAAELLSACGEAVVVAGIALEERLPHLCAALPPYDRYVFEQ